MSNAELKKQAVARAAIDYIEYDTSKCVIVAKYKSYFK